MSLSGRIHVLSAFGNSNLLGELVRYGATGLTLNGILLAGYIGLTHFGVPALLAACLTYWSGLPLSYFAHGRISFARRGAPHGGRAFVIGHLTGWCLNLGGLHALIQVGVPHQIGQAVMILVVAVWLFAFSKVFVFRGDRYKREPAQRDLTTR